MNISDYQLNENQSAAVEWNEGPLLVLAGPGSGKTLVLTLRCARLLQSNPDASVLALTFTTKAAVEMRQRLDKIMGGRADRAHLCTFHSFAGDILRQHGSHIGIQPDFLLLSNHEDRISILETAIDSLNGDKSAIPTDRKNLLLLIDRLFSESYGGEPTAPGMTKTPSWLPPLFAGYCAALKAGNRLDFGALLYFARVLLSTYVGVVRLTRLSWQFLCVDEFQDTNRAQYDLLTLLSVNKSPNLFVVADDDQIIYQWNGASPERLLALRSDFEMDVLQLPENYRCPPIIIRLANNLIGHNKARSNDKEPLVAKKRGSGDKVLMTDVFDDEDEEARNVAKVIMGYGWEAEDCVVLARTTKLLERVGRALSDEGLKPYIAKRKTEFESPAVHWLFEMLRLANARHDRSCLQRVCGAWNGFTEAVIEPENVEAQASLEGGDFLRTWVEVATSNVVSKDQRSLLGRVANDLVERLEFLGLLEWFWGNKWMNDELEAEEMQTWQELHEGLLREYSPGNINLHLYLQEIDLKSKAPIQVPGSVRCLTVHGAKGLEFKHVFLVGMAEGVFPSFQAVSKGPESKEIEEERRSCFVAITRTEETLSISFARSYNGYPKEPSRFLEEMGFTVKTSES